MARALPTDLQPHTHPRLGSWAQAVFVLQLLRVQELFLFFPQKPPEGSGPPLLGGRRVKGRCPPISRVSPYLWVSGSYSRMSASVPTPWPSTTHPTPTLSSSQPSAHQPSALPQGGSGQTLLCPAPSTPFPTRPLFCLSPLPSWVPPLCPVLCLILGPCL